MKDSAVFEKQKFIFGSLFLLTNKLQVLADRSLAAQGITIKQWFLTAVIEQFGSNYPTLNEVSEAMGSSHQNVKQIALKLEKKGFLQIQKDERDSRAIRFRLTEKSYDFWQKRYVEDKQFICGLFENLSEEEVNSMYECMNKLYQGILQKSKGL